MQSFLTCQCRLHRSLTNCLCTTPYQAAQYRQHGCHSENYFCCFQDRQLAVHDHYYPLFTIPADAVVEDFAVPPSPTTHLTCCELLNL